MSHPPAHRSVSPEFIWAAPAPPPSPPSTDWFRQEQDGRRGRRRNSWRRPGRPPSRVCHASRWAVAVHGAHGGRQTSAPAPDTARAAVSGTYLPTRVPAGRPAAFNLTTSAHTLHVRSVLFTCTRRGTPGRRTRPRRRQPSSCIRGSSLYLAIAYVRTWRIRQPAIASMGAHVIWAVMAGDTDRGPWARSGWQRRAGVGEPTGAETAGDDGGRGVPPVSGPWATRGPAAGFHAVRHGAKNNTVLQRKSINQSQPNPDARQSACLPHNNCIINQHTPSYYSIMSILSFWLQVVYD